MATVGGIRRLKKTRGPLERRCDELGAVAAPLGTTGGEYALIRWRVDFICSSEGEVRPNLSKSLGGVPFQSPTPRQYA